jgi:glycosyltransferase involved in cell wall biosynthesis
MQSESQPIVSVLITVYNREKYIAQAVESVLASTFKNFELIIVDDGSKDRSVEIAKSYVNTDSRVKLFLNENNLGDYPNRNKAASHAKGKYLKYIDADDYIYPWGLELLVKMMEDFPEAGWGLCSLEQNDSHPFPFMLSPEKAYEYHYLGTGLFHKAPLSAIIKKAAFDKVGGFAPLRMVGDFEMWHRLAQQNNLVLMPHGIVWYRKHEEQEMQLYINYILSYEEIKVKYLKDKQCPLMENKRVNILKSNKKIALRQLIRSILKLDFPLIKKKWKSLKLYND